MLNKIAPCRHKLSKNNENSTRRPWRAGRSNGKGFTIISNSVIDSAGLTGGEFKLLTVIARFAHNQTGEVMVEIGVLANAMGWGERWTQRVKGRLVTKGFLGETRVYDPALRLNKPNTYRILNPHKPVETTAQKTTTPDGQSATQSLQETPPQTQVKTPLPPQAGEPVCFDEPELEVSRPRGRHIHHHGPRPVRRRCGALTAFQQAAVEVMRLCGVVETSWRLRDGIAAAVALHVEGCEDRAKRAVEPMVIAWRDYLDDHDILRCPLGIESFFVLGAWCDRRQWRYDPDRLAAYKRR